MSTIDSSENQGQKSYDLFATNSGGLCLVCRSAGIGWVGFESGLNLKAYQSPLRNEFTFRSDTDVSAEHGDHFESLGDGDCYDALSSDDIEQLYEAEGETDAAVLVASRVGDEITVHVRDVGSAAAWYLATDMPAEDGADDVDEVVADDDEPSHTFEQYWNMVLGPRSPADVVREFRLNPKDRVGLDERLGVWESEAWSFCDNAAGVSGRHKVPEAWAPHHQKALALLCAVEPEPEADDDDGDWVIIEGSWA